MDFRGNRLVVERGDAERRLRTQHAEGELLNSRHIASESGLEVAKSNAHRWYYQTSQVLAEIFSASHFVDKYNHTPVLTLGPHPTFLQRVQQLRADVQSKSVVLQSILDMLPSLPAPKQPVGISVFIIHGHDHLAKVEVANFIQNLGMQPIILNELPNAGQTIIEKLEQTDNITLAVGILTPDDIGASASAPNQLRPRARQNVILELGYFTAALGRQNVVVLFKDGVEIPSDFHGLLYTELDAAGAWKLGLAREIRAAGILVDLNSALG